jgi:hypothetical protein
MEALLLVIGLGLIPVYMFASGGIQPSHLVLALLIGIRLIRMEWRLTRVDVTLVA